LNQTFKDKPMAHGLQAKVARDVGIHPQFLNAILRRGKKCPPDLALKLEERVGIKIRVWLYGTKTEKAAAWYNFAKKDVENYRN